MSSNPGTVGVIDLGSNTIKLLLARRAGTGGIEPLFLRTCESRISRGITGTPPLLTEEGMQAGFEAVEALLADCASRGAEHIVIVATSAVRSAANGPDFAARLQSRTGHALRILSGDEEAELIGHGLLADPALGGLRDLHVFDLGGGSMECLIFKDGLRRSALSLPLGCVRLTEAFIHEPSAPISSGEINAIRAHTRRLLQESGLRYDNPEAAAVFAGGSMTTARAIFGAALGLCLEQSPPEISLDDLEKLLWRIAALPLARRQSEIPGLPAARADVFPAALATMVEAGRFAGTSRFRHTTFNLRYGLAGRLLGV